jgi:hypothetical protein
VVPWPHAQFETEDRLIRGGSVRLYGDAHLKMDVTSFPVSEEASKEQKALREGLLELIGGKRKLGVSISDIDESISKNV